MELLLTYKDMFYFDDGSRACLFVLTISCLQGCAKLLGMWFYWIRVGRTYTFRLAFFGLPFTEKYFRFEISLLSILCMLIARMEMGTSRVSGDSDIIT